MWIWLDKTGKVLQYLKHGNSPVVGGTDFQIFAYFDGLDIDYFDSATIKFRRPDRQGSTYPILFMKRVSLDYVKMDEDGDSSKFNTTNSPYTGFLFDFADFTDDDDIVRLLDTPGLWEATISCLAGGTSKIKVSGLITFSVGPSSSDSDDQSELTLDQILQNLILNLQTLPKTSEVYFRTTENFITKASSGELTKNIFVANSIVFDETSKDVFRITNVTNNDSDETKVYAGYEQIATFNCLPLSGGTMSGDINMGQNAITELYALKMNSLDEEFTDIYIDSCFDILYTSQGGSAELKLSPYDFTLSMSAWEGETPFHIYEANGTKYAKIQNVLFEENSSNYIARFGGGLTIDYYYDESSTFSVGGVQLMNLSSETKSVEFYKGATVDEVKEQDTAVPNIKWVKDNFKAITYISTTWSELKSLRDNSQLLKGATYRIIDYQCTTTQFDTQSAGHQFDILVVADDVNVLNENARAIIHEGDTYFANSKLSAWELKYSLDNDTDRFVWASSASVNPRIYAAGLWFEYRGTLDIDGTTYYLWYNSEFNFFQEATPGYLATAEQRPSIGTKANVVNIDTPAIVLSNYVSIDDARLPSVEDGKGVIYYMKDEFNNECPYDFKNIQFKRIATLVSNTDLYNDSVFNSYHYWATFNYTPYGLKLDGGTITPEYIWVYTFHDAINNSDGSLNNTSLVYNNSIDTYQVYVSVDEANENKVIQLNNIVLYYQVIDDENLCTLYNNKFKNNCHTITISQNCYSNIFNDGCYENTFGNGCNNNVFNNDCRYNTFGNDCHSNTFGNSCSSNTFGNECRYNTFGEECNQNSFNYNCVCNTFGHECRKHIFGYWCSYNILGNNSYGFNLAGYCTYNNFGCYCRNIALEDYAQNNIFDNAVWYVELISSSSASLRNQLQNIHIHSGIQGTSSSNKKTITVERNLSYSVDYYANNSKTIILD